MSDYTLKLDWPAVDTLAYAIQRTMDDLEARAIVAEHHDEDLGPISADEYRADIARLRTVLDQISPSIRPANPELAAVPWIDGAVYAISDGEPVRMISEREVRELEDVAGVAMYRTGQVPPDPVIKPPQTDINHIHLDQNPSDPTTPSDEESPEERGHGHGLSRQAPSDPSTPSTEETPEERGHGHGLSRDLDPPEWL